MCKRGFTLIELLVVIAIVAILAAILFPVFAQARDKARQAMCQSNFKQMGTAFAMYASDYDGVFPNPGGSIFRLPIVSTWVYSDLPGIGGDTGGIWPYVKQRGNGGTSNVYACPNSLPGPNNVFRPGQNYVMNDYLRGCSPGQANFRNRDSICGWAYADGINPDLMVNPPAQVVLLYESAQHLTRKDVNRNGSPFFNTGASATPPLCIGMPQNYHAGKSNFLFCDTHVKALTPGATWEDIDQPAFESFNSNCSTLKQVLASGQYTGSAQATMWNSNFVRGAGYP